MEIAELEKSYQDQRKRLLGEIHGERLRQERENEVILMEKQKVLEQKFEKLVLEIQEKINKKEQEFQVCNFNNLIIKIKNRTEYKHQILVSFVLICIFNKS